MAAVFGGKQGKRDPAHPLLLTGVKANVGHLEAGAGMAGLFSLMLSLKHQQAPPNAQLREANPKVLSSLTATTAAAGMHAGEEGGGDVDCANDDIVLVTEPTPLRRMTSRSSISTPSSTSMVASGGPVSDHCWALPLLGGVSSFGYSGTIAHVILEEAPPAPCSTQTQTETEAGIEVVAGHSVAVDDDGSGSGCGTSILETAPGPRSCDDCTREHKETAAKEAVDDDYDDDEGHLQAWQFSGQGNLEVNMGRDMYDSEEVFRTALLRCDDAVRGHLPSPQLAQLAHVSQPHGAHPPVGLIVNEVNVSRGTLDSADSTDRVSITDILYPDVTGRLTTAEAVLLLRDSQYSQPALVALEYALAQVWASQDVAPDLLLGHSLGEYVAVVVAELLSLEDMLALVCLRGRLTQQCARCRGCMYAVRADEAAVLRAIDALAAADDAAAAAADDADNDDKHDRGRAQDQGSIRNQVSLAAVNGPRSCAVSGTEAAVQRLLQQLLPRGTGSVKLGNAYGFHSPLMLHVADEFRAALQQVHFRVQDCTLRHPVGATIPSRSQQRSQQRFVSTVYGREVSAAELADPAYWVAHMVQAVRYCAAVECTWDLGARTFLELGPQATLTKYARQILRPRALALLADTSTGDEGNGARGVDDVLQVVASLE